ncbi:ATP-binding cassette subfamily C protein CydD/ATP-binding cassette subfamily C protein CydCD [Amycolatopsis jiangsuensis]|uniref:ATP-binding cassette subfamily C protein CydD/ATP-binding cassette subfamily C protein CydCD n=2 Tax=Amycolatopsis jiangsuensis TaxID=1181879 RepID=A0A840IWT8_9PSEU|nr:ATP-binding cassette subfamily C protein CydD/ATP-binding cassette subfamily C protein CydCD [Amycolatopsis jiangsuensis]
MSGLLLELVRALPVLTAFRRAGAQAETVRKLSERHRRTTLKTLRVAFSSAFVLELAATLSVALIAVVIGVRLVSGSLPLAIGLGVLILAPECYQPIRAVGAAFHASEDGVEAVRRVRGVLAEPVPAEGTRSAPCGSLVVTDLKVARRQGFAPDGESFSVRRGQTVWLRAPSGGGKSTTLATLLGFVPSYGGSVLVGDVPLAEADLARWRAAVAWVPQNPVFSGGTVRAELAVADPGVSPDELAAPGDGASAGEAFIPRSGASPGLGGGVDEALSPRIDTDADTDEVLGELGLHGLADHPVDELSLGQRQRVAVARALLRVRSGAWLLLLDEPTAHLDQVNARRVLDAVDRAVANGAAAVIAAHERSTAVAVVDEKPLPAGKSPVDESVRQRPLPWRLLVDRRLLGGAALGALALLAGVALTATSGWLIAKASLQPPILTLTVAVVGVRAFGLGRAGLRYAERLMTHDAAFRTAGRLRVLLWNALVRRGPARTLDAGESQRRLVNDIDTVRDLLPRVVSPPIVVGLVAIGAVAIQTVVLPSAGLVLALAVLAGLAAPAVALRLERRATSALATGRRDVGAQVLGLFSSAAELLAYGAARVRRRALADTDTQLEAAARRQAFGAGAGDALITLVSGVAAVVCAMLAARAVAAGELAGVMAPLLALVPLALAEVLTLLPQAAAHGDTLRTARVRLAEVGITRDGSDFDPHVDNLMGGRAVDNPPPTRAGNGGSAVNGAVSADGTVSGEAVSSGRVSSGEAVSGEAASGGAVSSSRELASGRVVSGEVSSGRAAVSRQAMSSRRADAADREGSAGRGPGAPAVRVRGAELGWPGGPAVVKGVDLEVPVGGYVVVVGASGAGKSTLLAALLGFLAPRAGVVDAPAKVAWAPQEPMLVSTTVAENLRLADPRASADELRHVLDLAQLPDLDPSTVLGSAGAGLSDGQAQRVALARALLAAPSADLVLLDEPTSHLDEPTARALRTALRSELAGHTVLHVTHSVDEEVDADAVLEVRDGRVLRRAAPLVTG